MTTKTKLKAGVLALVLSSAALSSSASATWLYSGFISTWTIQSLDFPSPNATATVYFPPVVVADAETYHHHQNWVAVTLWCDNTAGTPPWITDFDFVQANCSGSGSRVMARGAAWIP